MASLLKLFQTLDPTTRFYLRSNHIAEVHEALLSSLAVCQPDDAFLWLISCLRELQSSPILVSNINWDYFIPECYHPLKRPFTVENSLSYVFAVCDETLEPSEKQISSAIEHYNHRTARKYFHAWLRYHLTRHAHLVLEEQTIQNAANYHRLHLLQVYFNEWNEWARFRLNRQKAAANHLTHCHEINQLRIILNEWNQVAQNARRTRDYFDRVERGEDNQAFDGFLSHGEARDELSLLTREAAVRILSYLDIDDLARCSQVCRQWKVLTQSSVLWSKLDLHQTSNVLDDKLAMRFIQRARPYLQHLNLRQCNRIGRLTFLGISSCKNLQDINLSECTAVNDEAITIMTAGCHILLYLNLSHTEITDTTFRSLSRNCPFLQFLSLAYSIKFSDRAFTYIINGKGCRKLLYLDITGCQQLSHVGFEGISEAFHDLEVSSKLDASQYE
ncbi:unnamed protein product [Didymodactylos carnosus]|uniref:F-box domain-containing protein n=1 Tax=Didymodactylos carnosus TaxID=1234261 RepID=A0A8S2PTL4_9BILA|nr:unnamed protein product [Didymodactylos carnosus]CAF4061869.1 unnamed protein product [Didymodactylos carnosus]